MTALELSDYKVRFTDVYNSFFDREPDENGQITLSCDAMSVLEHKIKEGIEIINEYLKEKG